jgi:cytoskeleton protein RodZ
MTSIGATLRSERLRRNLDLRQISEELKISSRFLEAIEAEHFDKLPGGIFTRAFVRQYAQLLGLDAEELAGQVQRALDPQSSTVQAAERSKAQADEIHLPRVEEWEAVGENRFRWSSSLSAAALVVVVMLVCSGVYAWWQRTRHVAAAPAVETTRAPQAASAVTSHVEPPVTAPPTPLQTTTAPTPVPNSASQPAKPAPAPPQSAVASPQPPPPTVKSAPATPSNPNAPVRVEITAEEPVWVLARGDGKYLFSGTLEAHQTRTVDANSNVELRLGNAGGVTITLNGKPLGALGPKGQVRTLQLTSGGFQIVPAKPAAFLDPLL